MAEKLKLKIDSNVIRQLGAELISGPEIALVELVKNSYDADANFCHINIDTTYIEQWNGTNYNGKITITDDGCGMDKQTINNSWLTISYSAKKEAKKAGKVTKLHYRTYTGDKGLGRLGSMRLGDICRIKTYNDENKNGISVTFSWGDFIPGKTLDEIHIEEEEISNEYAQTGTTIEIIGLHNFELLTSSLTSLQTKLANMVSPHKIIKGFKVLFTVDGIEQDIAKYTKILYGMSIAQHAFSFNNQKITISGNIKLPYFKPLKTNDRNHYFSYIEIDNGVELSKYLAEQKKLDKFNLSRSNSDSGFVTYETTISFDEIPFTTKITNPGPFDGHIYQYRRDELDIDDSEHPDKELYELLTEKDSKLLLQDILGDIAIYKDGFKLGSQPKDWLNLSRELTSGSGTYSLKIANVAGYINLTNKDNPDLTDKSDRENLLENEAYHIFLKICETVIKEINELLNESRRASLNFIRNKSIEDSNLPTTYSPEQAQADLRNLTSKSKSLFEKASIDKNRIVQSYEKHSISIDNLINENKNDLFHDSKSQKILTQLQSELNFLKNRTSTLHEDYLETLKKIADHEIAVQLINDSISSYKEQIKSFYDHVAIGLSAQYLSHEANAQLEYITSNTTLAMKRTKELNVNDHSLTQFHLKIRSNAQTLSKTISSLNPLLRSQRQKIESLNIYEQLLSYIEIVGPHLESKNIKIVFESKGKDKYIKFNQGKFFQIIDNIVRNSEFWLNLYGKHNPKTDKVIFICQDNFNITIWDTGKGIKPSVENFMFDMFVSEKKNGQGLGLFIVQNLLNERDCSINLIDDLNKYSRKYKLQINLHGAYSNE